MAKVTGIGGVFLKFKDPAKMKTWYQEVLGMTVNDYGVLFEFNGGAQKKAYLQLGTFESNTDYFGADHQQYMMNFRVDDLEGMVTVLKEARTKTVDEIASYSYGKFLHIEDPEGNRIELWEPVDKVFTDGPEAKMKME